MQIRFLELENFKSYSGLHRIGPFENKVSCIIGPNGCGKSNVLDSLLFIFGFKSEKLRQDNLKSLIHRSSKVFATSCRVSVILETKEGQIKITRAISQSGYSYYYLNDSKTTLEHLKGILFEHGIDLRTNHFMILQGEIQKLAELNPKELLGHMEYLFGSEPYIAEIDALTVQYGELQITEHTMLNVIRIKRKSIAQVKQISDRALNWVKCHVRVLKCEQQLLSLEIILCNENQECFNKELLQIQSQMQGSVERHRKLTNSLKTLEGQIPNCQRDIKAKRITYEQLDAQQNQIKLKLISLRTNIEFKEKDFTMVYNKKEDLKDELNRMKSIDCDKQLPILQKELKAAESQLQQRFSQESIKRFAQVARKKDELASKKEELETNENELTTLHKTFVEAKNQLEQLDMLRQQKQRTTSEIKAELNVLMNRMLKSKQNIKSYEQTLQQLRIKVTEITSARNSESLSTHLNKELKKASDLGILKGLHGRLRQYCWIDHKYQKAFNTVCPQLDYYIVDDYQGALAATNYLKSIKLGKATFIILEQLKAYPQIERAMKTKYNAPIDSQRLFDLVHADTYQNVVYWSIMDTLVVDNLEKALPIAYGGRRHRVVTLNGDFVDITGTMTSAPPSLNTKSIQQDVQSLKNREKLIEKLLQDEQAKLNKEIEQHNHKKKLMEATNVKKALLNDTQQGNERMVFYTAEEITFMQQKIAGLEASKKKLLVVIDRIVPQLEQLSVGMEPQSLDEYVIMKSTVDAVRAKLKSISSSEGICNRLVMRIETEQAKEKSLQEQINSMQKEQETLRNRKNQFDNDLEQAMSNITAAELEISQLIEQKRSFQNSLKESNENIISDKHRKIEQSLERNNSDRRKFNEKLDIVNGQIHEYRMHHIETINQLAVSELNQKKQIIEVVSTQFTKGIRLRPNDQDSVLISGDTKQYKAQLAILKEKLLEAESKGPIDFNSIVEFDRDNRALQAEESELERIKKEKQAISDNIQILKEKRLKAFLDGFTIVSEAVKVIYHELTKGDVDISLVDVLDPFSSGVELTVRPHNKTWKKVNLLSGGEKTMTALALTFAFSRIRHCPFYLMDEIDAALDYRNTGILAKYIKNQQCSQMVVISLRRNMYEEAGCLTGVYKIDNCSRTLTVKATDLESIRQSAIESREDEK